jgi:L-alanine-DL-glutamate epimerase-like enolase superfamily enzyme
VLTRRQAFQPWIEQRAVDILQPDCTKNGGLSESRRIAWAAYDHNIQLVPHGWNTAVGLAADLQLSAALPVARYVEYLTPCAYIEELTTQPFPLDASGCLLIPNRPGLGVELDRDRLKRYCSEPVTFR